MVSNLKCNTRLLDFGFEDLFWGIEAETGPQSGVDILVMVHRSVFAIGALAGAMSRRANVRQEDGGSEQGDGNTAFLRSLMPNIKYDSKVLSLRSRECRMGQILIRNLDDTAIAALKMRALENRTSLEQTARDILTAAARPSKAAAFAALDRISARGKASDVKSVDMIRAFRDGDDAHH